MELQTLEESVTAAEERALQLSLIGYDRLEADELTEAWQHLKNLENGLTLFTCDKSGRLVMRLASIRSELDGISKSFARGGDSIPPVAA